MDDAACAAPALRQHEQEDDGNHLGRTHALLDAVIARSADWSLKLLDNASNVAGVSINWVVGHSLRILYPEYLVQPHARRVPTELEPLGLLQEKKLALFALIDGHTQEIRRRLYTCCARRRGVRPAMQRIDNADQANGAQKSKTRPPPLRLGRDPARVLTTRHPRETPPTEASTGRHEAGSGGGGAFVVCSPRARERHSTSSSHVDDFASHRQPSPAYWPLPRISEASVACRLIDTKLGYPTQTYAIRTVDGYILTLIRIPRPESSRVCLFQHGLLDSASAWISTGNTFSLAARAYQEGCDVFLGNLRGSSDSLADNGFGSNPMDYLDTSSPSSSSAAASAARSGDDVHPLRGRGARARSIDVASDDAPGVHITFIGATPEGIPVHETLHPRQREYWNYNVSDHTLDIMAFLRHIRIIKALEMPQRKYLQQLARTQQQQQQQQQQQASESRGAPGRRAAAERSTRLRSSFAVESLDHASGGDSDWSRDGSDDAHTAAAGDVTDDSQADSAASGAPAGVFASRGSSSGGSAESQQHHPHIDATSEDADDCSIVGVGHSMGATALLLYVMHARALRRPHWLSRLVLLSPAGLHRHMNTAPKAFLVALRASGVLRRPGPFPARNSSLQRAGAKLMQDLKRTHSTNDAVSLLGARFFGGTMHGWIFRHLNLTEYPVGGSSTTVLKHGIQCMLRGEFSAYDFGTAVENVARYGRDRPPGYRPDYGIIDVPLHIVAGAADVLIPVKNLEEQYALLALLQPRGTVSMRTIDDAGHLDFTLTLSDEMVAHVLQQIALGHGLASRASASDPTYQDASGAGVPPSPSVLPTSPSPGQVQRVVPAVEHERIAEEDVMPPFEEGLRQIRRALNNEGGHEHLDSATSVTPAGLDPGVAAAVHDMAKTALQKLRSGHHEEERRPRPQWRPFAEQADKYPWLRCYTKLQLVEAGLDAEAAEMGLAPPGT